MDRMAGSRRRDAPNSSAIRTFRQRRACHSRPSPTTESISDRLLETCKERLAGWRQAHVDLEIPCDETLSVPTTMWDIESGRRLGREYLAGRHRCDAILAYGDWFTHGLLTVLHSADVRIPTDVASTAGDGYAWMRAAAPYHDLSFLRESRQKLVRTALTTLDDLFSGRTCPDRLLVPVDFIAGTSCGYSPAS